MPRDFLLFLKGFVMLRWKWIAGWVPCYLLIMLLCITGRFHQHGVSVLFPNPWHAAVEVYHRLFSVDSDPWGGGDALGFFGSPTI